MSTNDSSPNPNVVAANPTDIEPSTTNSFKVIAVVSTILFFTLGGAVYYSLFQASPQPDQNGSMKSADDQPAQASHASYKHKRQVDAPLSRAISHPRSSAVIKQPFFSQRRNIIIMIVSIAVLLLVAASLAVLAYFYFDQSVPIEPVKDPEETLPVEETQEVPNIPEKSYSDIINEYPKVFHYVFLGLALFISLTVYGIQRVWTNFPALKKEPNESWGNYFARNLFTLVPLIISLAILITLIYLAVIYPETVSLLVIPFLIYVADILISIVVVYGCTFVVIVPFFQKDTVTTRQKFASLFAAVGLVIMFAANVAYYFFNQDYYGEIWIGVRASAVPLTIVAAFVFGVDNFKKGFEDILPKLMTLMPGAY